MMKYTLDVGIRALQNAVKDHEGRLAQAVKDEQWQDAGRIDTYLDGIRFALEVVQLIQIEED
jgi:hypothetical protein